MVQKTFKQAHTYRVTLVRPLNADIRPNNLGILEKCAIFCNFSFRKGNSEENSEEREYDENKNRAVYVPSGVILGDAAKKALQNNGYMPQPRPNGSKGYQEAELTINIHQDTPLPIPRFRSFHPIEKLFEEEVKPESEKTLIIPEEFNKVSVTKPDSYFDWPI